MVKEEYCLRLRSGKITILNSDKEIEDILLKHKHVSKYDWSSCTIKNPFEKRNGSTLFVVSDADISLSPYPIHLIAPDLEIREKIQNRDNRISFHDKRRDYECFDTNALIEELSETDSVLIPHDAYIFDTIGNDITFFDWNTAVFLAEELTQIMFYIHITDNPFEPKVIINESVKRENIIRNTRERELEKAEWLVTEPVIPLSDLPNVDLVFIGDELEGHGTVNDFSIQNDWNDYNDNFGSKYYFEDQLEFQGFYWTLKNLTSWTTNNPLTDRDIASVVVTFKLESTINKWSELDDYLVELTKVVDDVAIAEYHMSDNRNNHGDTEVIWLGFNFKKLFGYFPETIVLSVKEVRFY